MVAAAGAAGVAEHKDALLVVHEGLRLGKVGRTGPALDAQTITPVITSDTHDAPRAAGDLGDHVRAEALDDLVERTLHRRKRRELLDPAVAPLDVVAALARDRKSTRLNSSH